MTANEKTQCYRIGLSFLGVGVTDKHAELLWRFAEKFEEKKGTMDIKDAIEIQRAVDRKYAIIKIKERGKKE